MMNSSLTGIICMLIMLTVATTEARTQNNVAKFQFGLNIGTFVYQGDLTPQSPGSYRTLRPMIIFFGAKFLSASLAARANLALGSLRGNDAAYSEPAYRQHRNFNFHSPVLEFSGIAEWNVLGRNYISHGFAPYVFAGGGISLVNIKRDYSHFDVEYFPSSAEVITGLNADVRHSTPRALLVLPVGVGMRYYFSDKLGVTAESSYRIMSNDYLDGFSLAANPDKGDHYYSHTIGVIYRLGKKNTLDCPVMKY